MLSKTSVYSIKIMIHLYLNALGEERKVGVSNIAEGIGSPKPFTAKVLQRLSKSRLIRSSPGPGGGYYLPENSNYTLKEVIEAVNEAHFLTSCLLGFEECSSEHPCALHERFVSTRTEMNVLFNNVTISEASESVKNGNALLLG
jgi:Rrf2 family protein